MDDNQLITRSPKYIAEWAYFAMGESLPLIVSGTQERVWEKLSDLNPLETVAFRSLYELRYRMDKSVDFWKSIDEINCADVMCWAGTVGYFLHQYLSHHGVKHTVDYIDWSQGMLDRVNKDSGDSSLILADVRNIDTLDKKYDIITVRFWFNNLTNFTEWEDAINSCLKLLKPQWRLYIIDHFWAWEIANLGFNRIEELIAKLDGRNLMPIFPSSDQMRKSLDRSSNLPSMNQETQEHCGIESWWNSFFPAEFRLYDRICEKNKRWQYNPPLTDEEIRVFVSEVQKEIQDKFSTTNAFVSVPGYVCIYEILRSNTPNSEVKKWFSIIQKTSGNLEI